LQFRLNGFAFSHDEINRSEHGRVEKTVEMYKNLTPEYFTDNIWSLGRYFDSHNKPCGVTMEDKIYLLDDFRYQYDRMETVIPKSDPEKFKNALISFASAFDNFGDKEKAIEVFKRIKREFPASAAFADQETEQLRNAINKRGGVPK